MKKSQIAIKEKKLVLCTVVEIGVPPGEGLEGRGGQSFYVGGRGR